MQPESIQLLDQVLMNEPIEHVGTHWAKLLLAIIAEPNNPAGFSLLKATEQWVRELGFLNQFEPKQQILKRRIAVCQMLLTTAATPDLAALTHPRVWAVLPRHVLQRWLEEVAFRNFDETNQRSITIVLFRLAPEALQAGRVDDPENSLSVAGLYSLLSLYNRWDSPLTQQEHQQRCCRMSVIRDLLNSQMGKPLLELNDQPASDYFRLCALLSAGLYSPDDYIESLMSFILSELAPPGGDRFKTYDKNKFWTLVQVLRDLLRRLSPTLAPPPNGTNELLSAALTACNQRTWSNGDAARHYPQALRQHLSGWQKWLERLEKSSVTGENCLELELRRLLACSGDFYSVDYEPTQLKLALNTIQYVNMVGTDQVFRFPNIEAVAETRERLLTQQRNYRAGDSPAPTGESYVSFWLPGNIKPPIELRFECLQGEQLPIRQLGELPILVTDELCLFHMRYRLARVSWLCWRAAKAIFPDLTWANAMHGSPQELLDAIAAKYRSQLATEMGSDEHLLLMATNAARRCYAYLTNPVATGARRQTPLEQADERIAEALVKSSGTPQELRNLLTDCFSLTNPVTKEQLQVLPHTSFCPLSQIYAVWSHDYGDQALTTEARNRLRARLTLLQRVALLPTATAGSSYASSIGSLPMANMNEAPSEHAFVTQITLRHHFSGLLGLRKHGAPYGEWFSDSELIAAISKHPHFDQQFGTKLAANIGWLRRRLLDDPTLLHIWLSNKTNQLARTPLARMSAENVGMHRKGCVLALQLLCRAHNATVFLGHIEREEQFLEAVLNYSSNEGYLNGLPRQLALALRTWFSLPGREDDLIIQRALADLERIELPELFDTSEQAANILAAADSFIESIRRRLQPTFHIDDDYYSPSQLLERLQMLHAELPSFYPRLGQIEQLAGIASQLVARAEAAANPPEIGSAQRLRRLFATGD